MTKAGQPSLVQDIRFFEGRGYTYVNKCDEATAFARRVSLLLRSRGYSFGTWHHLYMRAVEGDPAEIAALPTEGLEWWHRFVDVSVPQGFALLDEGERNQLLISRLSSVLRSLFPNGGSLLEAILEEAERERDHLRFLIKRKKIGGRTVEASFNVAVWPHSSDLLIIIKDIASEVNLASPPIKLKFYSDAFKLVADIREQDEAIILVPRKSFTAGSVAAPYATSLTIPLSSFSPIVCPPYMSPLVGGAR